MGHFGRRNHLRDVEEEGRVAPLVASDRVATEKLNNNKMVVLRTMLAREMLVYGSSV